MFAPRFDPTALEGINTLEQKNQRKKWDSKKRKLSVTSLEEDSTSSSSSSSSESSDSESDSDSDSDSNSNSDSDSGSSSDSDSGSKSETGPDSESDTEEHSETDIAKDSKDVDMADIKEKEDKQENANVDSDGMDIDNDDEYDNVENDPEYMSKHHSIFKKFKSSVPEGKDENKHYKDSSESEDVEAQDLAPLPQPELPRDKRLVSTSAHMNNLDWLATPIYSSPEETKPFSEFKNPSLSPLLLKNLKNMGFENAFSVQISVLNLMLEDIEKNRLQPDTRGDLLVNASTGSGKTLAYLIPIIQSLSTVKVPRVRAIILVPTKPLINQVKTTLNQLSKGTNLSVVSLKNDVSIKEEGIKLQTNEPDIIISTPGRLVDHLNNGSISLKNLQFLVIDEADRLLNQSFQNWCQVLVGKIEEFSSHQRNISNFWKLNVKKLIFSATLTTDAGKLALLKFYKPRLVIINNKEQLVNELFSVPAALTEYKLQFGSAKSALKPLILSKFLISQNKLSNVLIFTKSNDASLRLSRLLSLIMNKIGSSTINIAYINSTNNTSFIRSKILKDFSKQAINIVVATDLIARGIDILSITDVINYDLPNSSREYVHRVGRTARANQEGFAYNFCFGKGEAKWFKTIMGQVGRAQKNVEDLEIDSKTLIQDRDETLYKECLDELQRQVFNRA